MTFTVDFLSGITGHSDMIIREDEPEKRVELAKIVTDLLKLGHAVFVERGTETFKVTGYDAEQNRWNIQGLDAGAPELSRVAELKKGEPKRRGRRSIAAAGTRATAVAPSAGG